MLISKTANEPRAFEFPRFRAASHSETTATLQRHGFLKLCFFPPPEKWRRKHQPSGTISGKKDVLSSPQFPCFQSFQNAGGMGEKEKKTKQREGFLSVLSTPPVHPHPQKVHLKHHFLDAARTYTAENKQANRLHAIYGVYVLIRCRA